MTEIHEMSAQSLSAKIEAKEVSCVEVMTAMLDRIEDVNGALNAVVCMRDRDDLIAEARVADATPRKGWLHGIPFAMKEPVDVKGMPSSIGSPLLKDLIATSDAVMTARTKADGAIIIGKTNLPEFGLGSHTFNPVYGTTSNPYNPDRTCGGSSGGAAVVLAARMLPLADGSDVMGSLRNPAAWNNVYGMRPSFGLVPHEPKGSYYEPEIYTAGPMARNPQDLARLLQTQAGANPQTKHNQSFTANLSDAPSLSGKRIGWLGDWGGAYAYDDGIADQCEAALRKMEELGATVENVAPPFPAEKLWDAWTKLRSWWNVGKLGPLWRDPSKRDAIKADARWEVECGLKLTSTDLYEAGLVASDWFRTSADMFTQFDALVLPTAQVWPFQKDLDWPHEIAGRKMDTYHRWMEVVIPVSLIGLPSISIPIGFGKSDLPMGMQLFGPRGADHALLQMTQAYHLATDWPGQRPPQL